MSEFASSAAMRCVGRRGVRTASAARAIVFRLLRSCDTAVQKHFPAVVNIQSSGFDVAVSCCLSADGNELRFHLTNCGAGQYQTDNKADKYPGGRQRLARETTDVIRLIGLCLRYEFVAQSDVRRESPGKITVRQIRYYLLPDIFDSGVSEYGDSVATGRDIPVVPSRFAP